MYYHKRLLSKNNNNKKEKKMVTKKIFNMYYNTLVKFNGKSYVVKIPAMPLTDNVKNATIKNIFILFLQKGDEKNESHYEHVFFDGQCFISVPEVLYKKIYNIEHVHWGSNITQTTLYSSTITHTQMPQKHYQELKNKCNYMDTNADMLDAIEHVGWLVEKGECIKKKNTSCDKKEVLQFIYSILQELESRQEQIQEITIPDLSNSEIIAPIVRFVHHYCMRELSLLPPPPQIKNETVVRVADWISEKRLDNTC